MTALPEHPLLVCTKQDIQKVRQGYGLDVNLITDGLSAVMDWCLKQPHLQEGCRHLDRNILEKILLLSKGSIEETKRRVDKLLTSRGMLPELFQNRSIEEFDKLLDIVNYIPLAKLSSDQTRVMVTQFVSDNYDDLSIQSYFRYNFFIGEYRLVYEYCVGERFIIDLKNVNLGILTKLNPIIMKKAEVMCSEGYGTKIKGIHIVNAPSFVDRLLFILKQALREKVASRLHVHPTYEDLHKHIPKEILPKDYGGDGQSIAKIAVQWRDILRTDEARKIIKNIDTFVSDETKRNSAKFNEEYLGMPGSFRKLNVD